MSDVNSSTRLPAPEGNIKWLASQDSNALAQASASLHWNGMNFFNHKHNNYYGNIGVYGNRGANFILQSADRLLVLGSRLDNRQRGKVEKLGKKGSKK